VTAIDPTSQMIETPPAALLEMVIQPKKGWIAIDWAEMFRYRELLYFLVWRDVKVRYKQTVLGFAWAIIQPLMNALISVLIFGTVASFQKYLDPYRVPYMLFALVGQIAWQFFQTGVSSGGMSLVNQQHLLTKIYFPRLFLPTGVVGGALVDLALSCLVLAAFMIGYHFTHYQFVPPAQIVLTVLMLIPLIIISLGMSYLLSAVTVTFRDFRFIIPFMTTLWSTVSFVSIPRELLTSSPKFQRMEWVLALNPMYGIIEGFRHTLLGMPWNPWHLVLGTVLSAALCVFGAFYFRKTERRFADIA
jgi:lipopolysaccharide transport system permease protein